MPQSSHYGILLRAGGWPEDLVREFERQEARRDDGCVLLDVNHLITGSREGLLAAVVDDSTRPDIEPGYIVFLDPQAKPTNGDTVVVNINGENCIKIFDCVDRQLYLVPKNNSARKRAAAASHLVGVVKGHLALY